MLPGETITTCIIIYEPLTPPLARVSDLLGLGGVIPPAPLPTLRNIYRWTGGRRRRKRKEKKIIDDTFVDFNDF